MSDDYEADRREYLAALEEMLPTLMAEDNLAFMSEWFDQDEIASVSESVPTTIQNHHTTKEGNEDARHQ